MPGVPSPPCMMTPESDLGSPSAISPSVHDNNLRAIIRQLLSRYGREEINRLVEEEASSGQIGHVRLPETAISHHLSRDSLTTQTTALNHRSTSCSLQTPNPQRHDISSKPLSSQRPHRQATSSRGPGVVAAPQRLDYACGFCAEEDIRKTCTRRNDLRRHIENFHNKNAVWFCQHPDCKMAYDWQSAYQTHLRTAHGRSHMKVDEAMIRVCPQTVFACGFENCTRVFESCSEKEAATTLKEYSGHVVKHLEQGSNSGRWSYSTRLRNLLRQSQVSALWEKAWPEMERPQLRWDTQTSMAARKMLEAGHLEKLPFLIRFLIASGSEGGDSAELEGRVEPPVKERCPAPDSHRLLLLDTQAHSPHHELERDMHQFKVSGTMGLAYESGPGAYHGTMQPAHQVSRSVEAFSTELAERAACVDRRQEQRHQGNYSDAAGGGLRPLTPPRLFYHGPPSSTMFGPSPAILPAALQPLQQLQQHAARHYVSVAQEAESVVHPACFHGMQPPTAANLASGIDLNVDVDVDMAGSGVDHYDHSAPPPADVHSHSDRESVAWMGPCSHMAMHAPSSLSSQEYHVTSTATPEHNRALLGHFGSSEG